MQVFELYITYITGHRSHPHLRHPYYTVTELNPEYKPRGGEVSRFGF